jgi:hypothetical protein
VDTPLARPRPRARNRYAHLYMPLVTTVVILANPPIVYQLTNLTHRPWNAFLWIAFFTLFTYIVG